MKKRSIVFGSIFVIIVINIYIDFDNIQRHETHRGKGVNVISTQWDWKWSPCMNRTWEIFLLRVPNLQRWKQCTTWEKEVRNNSKEQTYKPESIREKAGSAGRKIRDRIFQIAPTASAKTSKKELENPDYSFKKWIRFPWKHGTFDYTKFKKREFIPKIIDKWFPDDDYKQVRINYMYEVSNENMDFVKTLKAENWQMMLHLQSFCHQWWKRERSYWLCQLNYRRHKAFIESDDWDKRYAQINYCRDVRDDAVNKKRLRSTFYWYSARKWAWAKVVLIK